jgi:hypothetical protein
LGREKYKEEIGLNINRNSLEKIKQRKEERNTLSELIIFGLIDIFLILSLNIR